MSQVLKDDNPGVRPLAGQVVEKRPENGVSLRSAKMISQALRMESEQIARRLELVLTDNFPGGDPSLDLYPNVVCGG